MSSEPNQPPVVPGPREPGQPAAAPAYTAPVAAQQPEPMAYEQPAYEPAPAERSLLEKRPEILIGIATAGGFVAAQILGRMRGR